MKIVKARKWLQWIMLYLSITGIIGFTLFILEEASQQVVFSSWAAQDARRWDIVLEGCDLNRRILKTAEIITWGLSWVNPLTFISYKNYISAARLYIRAAEAKAFAHDPALFEGRHVTFIFNPNRSITFKGIRYLAGGGVLVPGSEFKRQQVSGTLIRTGNFLCVRPESPDLCKGTER